MNTRRGAHCALLTVLGRCAVLSLALGRPTTSQKPSVRKIVGHLRRIWDLGCLASPLCSPCLLPVWLLCDNNPWDGSRARARTFFAGRVRILVLVCFAPENPTHALALHRHWLDRPHLKPPASGFRGGDLATPPALVVRCTERHGACRAVSRALARSRAILFCSVMVVGIFGHYFAALEMAEVGSALTSINREIKPRVPFLLSGTGAEAHVERANCGGRRPDAYVPTCLLAARSRAREKIGCAVVIWKILHWHWEMA